METFYIRLEKLPQGSNHASTVEGRAAALNWKKLNAIAVELNVKPLQSFVNDDTTSRETKEIWHSPADALVTIRKLLTRIASDKKAFENVRLLIRDLNGYENILSASQARHSKFQFATNFERDSSTPQP